MPRAGADLDGQAPHPQRPAAPEGPKGRASSGAMGTAAWTAGWALPGLLMCTTSQGEAGNLTLLFINLRKPNKQSLLEARPGFAMDIWKMLPYFPISAGCPRRTQGDGGALSMWTTSLQAELTGAGTPSECHIGWSEGQLSGSSHLVPVCEARHKERRQCVLEPSAWPTRPHPRRPHHTPACFSS